MKAIAIACQAAALVPTDSLVIIQGGLKSLNDANFAKLADEITERGFSFAVHVWRDEHGEKAPPGSLCILDGTQRIRVVRHIVANGYKGERYECREVPIAYVFAASYKEAVLKLLAGAGAYGKPEGEGLYELMHAAKISLEELKNIQLPGCELPKFKREFFSEGGEEHSSLVDRFIVPPFSTLDTRQGYWQERKRKWMAAIGEKGETREKTLGFSSLTELNNGVSILDPVLAECMVRWFGIPGGKVIDPFAGDTVFGWVAKRLGQHFTGIELREEQARTNQRRCDALKAEGSARYICDTSENIHKHVETLTQDFMFSCPPYFDLEVYSDLPNDLSNQGSYEDFLKLIDGILGQTVTTLKQNRFAVLVITEIRDKAGAYRAWVPHTIERMRELGLHFYNDLVLINAVGTAQVRAGKLMGNRKVARLHQNVLVFYKGDMKAIKDDFPKLEADVVEP